MPQTTVVTSQTIDQHFEMRQRLVAEIDALTEQLDFENQAIKDKMTAAGVDTYQVGDQVLVLSAREGRKTLDKTLLVDLGVGTDVIEKATKQGKGYVQLDVREKK